MAHDVFIIYATEDKLTADAVVATLEGDRLRCWIAPRDVLPGISWALAIIEAINQSRIIVLIFSSRSNDSRQVMNEVERAASKGIPIIPFRIEDVPLSPSLELFISSRHWLDALTPPLEQHLQHLAETVNMLLSRESEREQLGTGTGAPSASAAADLEALNEAIRQAPNHAPSYLKRADILSRLGMLSQAEADRRLAHQLTQSSAYTPPPAYGAPVSTPAALTPSPGYGPSTPDRGVKSYAAFGMRFGAWLIDSVIGVAAFLVFSFVAGFVIGFSDPNATNEELDDAIEQAIVIVLIVVGVTWILYLWLANSWGGTLGKRALGLRVVSARDESDIGPLRGLVRYLVYLVGSIPLYLGSLWMLWDDQKQTWHDKAAGSIVVRKR